jgi:hypothetical protein
MKRRVGWLTRWDGWLSGPGQAPENRVGGGAPGGYQETFTVVVGLGRSVALYDRSSNLYQIH